MTNAQNIPLSRKHLIARSAKLARCYDQHVRSVRFNSLRLLPKASNQHGTATARDGLSVHTERLPSAQETRRPIPTVSSLIVPRRGRASAYAALRLPTLPKAYSLDVTLKLSAVTPPCCQMVRNRPLPTPTLPKVAAAATVSGFLCQTDASQTCPASTCAVRHLPLR